MKSIILFLAFGIFASANSAWAYDENQIQSALANLPKDGSVTVIIIRNDPSNRDVNKEHGVEYRHPNLLSSALRY